MTFKVIAETEAKPEWNEAVEWYEQRHPGLGLRFNDDLRIFLQSLARNPERFHLVTRLVRKAKIPRTWPYSVYFTIDGVNREVKIVAVWHAARNPGELRRRLR